MLAVSAGSFLPLMVPRCCITRCFSNNFTEGSCLDEKFREAECHVSTFGVDRTQRVSVTRRGVCLKGFKVVGHEFAVNPRLAGVRPNLTPLDLREMGCIYTRPVVFFIKVRFMGRRPNPTNPVQYHFSRQKSTQPV